MNVNYEPISENRINKSYDLAYRLNIYEMTLMHELVHFETKKNCMSNHRKYTSH